jgi:hypothetical protein
MDQPQTTVAHADPSGRWMEMNEARCDASGQRQRDRALVWQTTGQAIGCNKPVQHANVSRDKSKRRT